MSNKIKISHNQWLSAGIKKGIVAQEKDGTYTLNKKAIAPAAAALFGTPLRSFITSGVAGALGSLFSKTSLTEKIQDWWRGGTETPEMLEILEQARDSFVKDVKPKLQGITARLDSNLADIEKEFQERIQTFAQRLNERGIGPAYQKGQELVAQEERIKRMLEAAKNAPKNTGDIKHLMTSGTASKAPAPQTSSQQAGSTGQSSTSPTQTTQPQSTQPTSRNPVIEDWTNANTSSSS